MKKKKTWLRISVFIIAFIVFYLILHNWDALKSLIFG